MCGQGVEVQTEWSFFMGMGDQDDYFLGNGGVSRSLGVRFWITLIVHLTVYLGSGDKDFTNCPYLVGAGLHQMPC